MIFMMVTVNGRHLTPYDSIKGHPTHVSADIFISQVCAVVSRLSAGDLFVPALPCHTQKRGS